MVDKVGHVKNPLTIIAIFAGLAEVFGTVMLPLLDSSVQFIFVWFLMFFPIALVSSFFFLLWHKHEVLYAPSDFRSDDLFERIYRNRSPLDKISQVEIESAQQTEDETGSKTDCSAQDIESNATTPQPTSETEPYSDEPPVKYREKFAAGTPLTRHHSNEVAMNYLVEEIGTEILSRVTGLNFDRNVSFHNSQYIYDAVSINADRAVVAEFKYVQSSSEGAIRSAIRRMIETLARAHKDMPNQLKSKFEGAGVLLIDRYNEKTSEVAHLAFKRYQDLIGPSIPMKLHIFSISKGTSS